MAKHYKFGMSVESVQSNPEHPDFDVNRKSTGSEQENPNPYGKSWFDDPKNMSKVEKSPARITSIPSPYARMHITDLAFRELNSGSSTMSESDMMGKVISKDYLHAMSHCLDMFELFYYFDDLDLKEKGIRIERIDLVNPSDPAAGDFFRKNPQTKNYLETLQLYRNQYIKALDRNRPGNYKFRFDALYVFWDEVSNTVIGATSPFTGFFAKSTCDVLTKGPVCEARLTIRKPGYSHNLLTNNPDDWLTLKNRPKDFQKFLYLLLHKNTENLGVVFSNLFKTVEMVIGEGDRAMYDNLSFNEEYPEYNFGDEKLPKILSGKDAYLRISDLDRSSLKYLLYLYLDSPIGFDVPESAFEKPIDQREFPDGSGVSVPWICVNDLLSDALFVLPYDVNDRYVAVPYYDKATKKSYRRCLLPIKQRVLEYFPDQSLADIAQNLDIVKYEDHFVVNYKVKLDKKDSAGNPVYINLRREYKPGVYEYPNGVLIGPSQMENFAFGIYPFVRSSSYTNIYKVLFYNKFPLSITARQPEISLNFYYFSVNANRNEKRPIQFNRESIKENYTGVYNPSYPDKTLNSIYYSIQEENDTNRTKCIEFAELHMDIKDELGNTLTDGTSLIVPLLEERETRDDNETYISVDLGTSNTYIAYMRKGETSPREINTIHADNNRKQYSELQFMNEAASKDDFEDVKTKYGHDLYLRPSLDPHQEENESADELAERKKKMWTSCIPTQFCEFIPAHIVPRSEVQRSFSGKALDRKGEGFSFPIPTVINTLRMNDRPIQIEKGNNVDSVLQNNQPLTHSSIPFAYYEIGKRPYGDTIAEGDFKWFMNKNEINVKNELNLTMFVSELLFILRSNMLSEGFALDKCKLYWTYPLSFDKTLEENTAEIWKKAYRKYFTKESDDIKDDELDNSVKCTNESLSPFYECVPPSEQEVFTVLMDIGGGSTDIIGYDYNKARFITSFEFAGNALYLNSKRNHPYRSDQKNVFTYYLYKEGSCQEMKNSQRNSYFGDATRLITGIVNDNNGLAALMNYGFQVYEKDFKLLFQYPEIKFMLQFYAAAIVYHTAQLCLWYSQKQTKEQNDKPLALPHYIYLTGNGSKLLNLLGSEERNNLIQTIFMKVYGRKELGEDELIIKTPVNPKVATARGALKAPEDMFNNRPAQCVTMLGDDPSVANPFPSVYERGSLNRQYEVSSGYDKEAMLKSVHNNVNKFIDVFYEYLGTEHPFVYKDTVLRQIDDVEKDTDSFRIGNYVSDSFFFLYIARIMEKISQRLVDKLEDKRS